MIRNAKIQVIGTVQGVFFRRSVKLKADTLNLRGLARNEPDGSVTIEVQGEEEALNEFFAWCKKGSPPAAVASADVEFQPDLKYYKDFSIA